MDYQAPLVPQEPPKKRIRLLPILLAVAAVVTLVRFVFRDPWDGYRTVDYEDMQYLRPDTSLFFSTIDRMVEKAQEGKDYSAVQDAYGELNRLYADYLSQGTLCYVRYSLDTQDAFYAAEQSFFDENDALVEQKLDGMYYALADSPFEDQLETDYFGEGFFDSYRGESSYNEALVRLLQEEDALISEYSLLMANPTLLYEGKEQPYRTLITQVSAEKVPYVIDLFYEKYAPLAAQLYCELVPLRRQIAKALGYESYADYIYASYSRSFTPEDTKDYCQSVRSQLLPFLLSLYENGILDQYSGIYSMEEEDLRLFFSLAVKQLGTAAEEAMQFMQKYSLCLLSDGENRIPGSYTTYLYNYDAPIIVAQQSHTSEDLVTVAHEFGHFFEYYVNQGLSSGIDVGECLSQGMELLVFSHLDTLMQEKDAEYLEQSRLLFMLEAIVEQAGFHEFELAVYDLPQDRLTPETLLELSEQYLGGGAIRYSGSSENAAAAWVSINHFFTSPFYTISYSLSADVALQLYQLDQTDSAEEPLLALARGKERYDLSQAVTDAGFADPLSQERVAALKELFEKHFSAA